jgi:hypothetical protein
MTTLILTEEDVAQAIADYVRKITCHEMASKISSVCVETDSILPNSKLLPVKVKKRG